MVATDDEGLSLIHKRHLFGLGIGYVDAQLLAATTLTTGHAYGRATSNSLSSLLGTDSPGLTPPSSDSAGRRRSTPLEIPGVSSGSACGDRAESRSEPNLDSRDLGAVSARSLARAGNDDLVTLEQTVALYRALPAAELAIRPNASHLLLLEHADAVRDMVRTFLTADPLLTCMPILPADR